MRDSSRFLGVAKVALRITRLRTRVAWLIVVGLALTTGQAKAQTTSAVVSAATDYQSQGFPTLADLVQHDLDTYDVVYFDSSHGAIDLSGLGSDTPILTIRTKSVSLESLDSQHPAALSLIDRGIVVVGDAGTAIDVSFKNLNIQYNRTLSTRSTPVTVSACNNVTFSRCNLSTTGSSHGIWFQGTVTGNIAITNCTLNCADGMPIGMIGDGTFTPSFLVQGCTFNAGGQNGFAISLAKANGKMTFRHNLVTSSAVGLAIWNYLGGTIDGSDNEITVDHTAWWGNGIGVFADGSDPQSTSVYDHNTVHLKTGTSIGFGAGDDNHVTYNVTFQNSVVDGQGWWAAGLGNSHGCTILNIDRSNLTVTPRPNFPLCDYGLILGSTGNKVVDHGTPLATVYEDETSAGQNQLDLMAAPPTSAPQLTINLRAGKPILTFDGTLQAADADTGPWADLQGASPMTITPIGAMKFYRAKR